MNKISKDTIKMVKRALARDPLIVHKNLAQFYKMYDLFVPNYTYITEKGFYAGTKQKPLEGEIGIFDGVRIVINLPAK